VQCNAPCRVFIITLHSCGNETNIEELTTGASAPPTYDDDNGILVECCWQVFRFTLSIWLRNSWWGGYTLSFRSSLCCFYVFPADQDWYVLSSIIKDVVHMKPSKATPLSYSNTSLLRSPFVTTSNRVNMVTSLTGFTCYMLCGTYFELSYGDLYLDVTVLPRWR